MVVFLGLGALAALIVVVSTFIIIRLQKLEAVDANLALEQYKLGVAAQVAAANEAGIEAGKMAGNAVLRAAELEKEAANARLETEKIKEVVAWRALPPTVASELRKNLVGQTGVCQPAIYGWRPVGVIPSHPNFTNSDPSPLEVCPWSG